MLAAHKAMATRKWPKLSEAAVQFGVTQPSAHRALVDVRTACGIHNQIMRAKKVISA
jgi:hypothetical protein